MPAISPAALVARLRAATDPAADRDLLQAFLADRDEPAFAALVRRHGPMVLGVCRRVLGNPHDADDAFQATFLVLARKANTVGRPDRLPGWLHTIAVRTATEVRRMRDRRRKLEASGGRQPPECTPRSPEQSELATILDEELAKLPEHYRVPVVLCELQGLPRQEAAARLKLAEGTLSSRLAKARKLLADRLTRRGVTASTATITAAFARETSARVPAVLAVEAARAALTSAASAVAVHAADGVVKALLVTKLKGLALAVGVAVACAGGVTMLSGGAGSAADDGDRPAARVPGHEPDPAVLVKQLGGSSFADREDAENKLKAMGTKAKPAVLTGTKDADPEIARRSAAVLAHIWREQYWPRFARLLGDDAHSRALYDAICTVPRNVELIEAAEERTEDVSRLYADRRTEINERLIHRSNPRIISLPLDVSAAEVAGYLYLGTFPGATDGKSARPGTQVWFLVSSKDMWRDTRFPFSAALTEGRLKVGSRRLLVKWLEANTDPYELEKGLTGALAFELADIVPFAREHVRKSAAGQTKSLWVSVPVALSAIGKLGAKDDLPFLRQFADDRTVIHRVHVPYPEDNRNSPREFRPGKDAAAEMRDLAVVAALVLCGQSWKQIDEYGFLRSRYDPRDAGRRGDDPELHGDVGFIRNEDRESAHKKAREFLDKQPKPAPKKEEPDPEADELVKQLGSPAFADRDAAERKLKALGPRVKPVVRAAIKNADPEVARRCAAVLDHVLREQAWPRFAKLIGDDQDARALFEAIRTVPRNVELIEAAEEQSKSVAKLYTDRERELNEQCRLAPGKDGWNPGRVSVGEVAGWMYLGTFPGAEKGGGDHNVFLLDFPDMWRHPSSPYPFPAALAAGPHKVGARRILVKWTEARIGRRDFYKGLNGAIAHGVSEMVPVAKKYLTEVKDVENNHGLCLAAIGKLGTKDDLPFLAKYADDRRVTHGAIVNHPGDEANPPREFRPGKDQEAQMRDMAMAMMLVLHGATREQLDEFGFFVSRYWPRYSGAAGPPAPLPPVGKRPLAGDDPFTPSHIGFIHDADRDAAHQKAKAWLARTDRSR